MITIWSILFFILIRSSFFDFIISEAAEMGWFSSIDQAVPSVVFCSIILITASINFKPANTQKLTGDDCIARWGVTLHLPGLQHTHPYIYLYIPTSFFMFKTSFWFWAMAKNTKTIFNVVFISWAATLQSKAKSMWIILIWFAAFFPYPSFRVRVVFIWWIGMLTIIDVKNFKIANSRNNI